MNEINDDIIHINKKEELEVILGNLLIKKNLTISTAESCTGGLISSRITDIPGSSKYFLGGFIIYSNEAKIKQLHIKEDTLKRFGAVSKETAGEMAKNIKEIMESDIGLSITGIAGPGGGTEEKPVGLVYIGLAYKEDVKVYRIELEEDRKNNKWMSSQHALYYVYKYIFSKEDF